MDMIESNARKEYAKAILGQISLQGGLIGGFSYAGLTQVPFAHTHPYLERAFSISSTFSICLEAFAVFASGCLIFVSANADIAENKWKTPKFVCWIAYIIGLAFFFCSVALIPWIAGRDAKLVTLLIVSLTVVAFVFVYIWIGKLKRASS